MRPDETAFEAEIEAWLLDHGYAKGDPRRFDRALGLDPGELLAFVAATQPDGVGAADPASTAARTAARSRVRSSGSRQSSTSAARSMCCVTA